MSKNSVLMVAACAIVGASALADDRVDPAVMFSHIKMLSSDAFEGRSPGSEGEEKTIQYITEQFKLIGAKPGNPDGSYIQSVPLVGMRSTPQWTLGGCASALSLSAPDEYVAWTTQVQESINVKNSELVFVGYGVQAPEYDWDDYKNMDVKGKTLVMLINDPAIPDPADPEKLDNTMFKGRAMTYYGRWTYKYEIAAAKGAAGAIIIHETGPAAYPYDVVRNNGVSENMTLKSVDKNAGDVPMRSWIREDKARALLSICGQDFDQLKKMALQKNFKPVVLNATLTASLVNQLREVNSHNVVARVEGRDKKLKNEHVVYTAHWDHLGVTEENGVKKIFNGAVDNASGIAAILEVARLYVKNAKSMKRSTLFVAVTAEEKGLLGSQYYAQNPLYPIKTTIANLNVDSLRPWGKAKDVQLIGSGQTTIEVLVETNAKAQDRYVVADARPETGGYFRSDHFNFVKKGVPALYMTSGVDLRDQPAGTGEKMGKEFTANHYHKDSDEVNEGWDMSGMAQDAELLYMIGRDISRDLKPVQFLDTSEFRRIELERLK